METCLCKYCGKLFNSYSNVTTCKDCLPIDNKRFHLIEAYLRKHPGSNAIQVSNALDFKISEVMQYISDGRLTIADDEVKIPKGNER